MGRDTKGSPPKSGGAYRHEPEHKVRLRGDIGRLDKRTYAAKKAGAILQGILNDLGGEDRVTVAQRQLATRAAVLCSIASALEYEYLTGEFDIDHGHYRSTVDTLRRCLTSLGLAQRVMRDVSSASSLAEYLRTKELEGTATEDEAEDASEEAA